MGVYNPHLPVILGQELVPIRDESLLYTGVANNVERGYSFMPTANRTLTEARFYINQFPSAYAPSHVYTANIYPMGQEAQSGPIRSVIIPCNNGGITGSGISLPSGTASVAAALRDPSDLAYVRVNLGLQAQLSMFFATSQYANILNGKRILGVNFLYAADQLNPGDLDDVTSQTNAFPINLRTDLAQGLWDYPALFAGTALSTFLNEGTNFQANTINRIALGDTNMFFNTTGVGTISCMPWTYTDLLRFEQSSLATRLFIWANSTSLGGTAPVWALDYAALEVIFCEEKRVAVGSTLFMYQAAGVSTAGQPFTLGANSITMRAMDGTANPTLLSGLPYTVTLSRSNTGDQVLTGGATSSSVVLGPEASVNAVREYYALSSHPAYEMDIPAPPTPEIDGQVFEKAEVEIMPQISLHTSSAALPECQVYGRQAVAQVYGTITATQNIFDVGIAAASYPQVRFYARRFGNTTTSLTLSSTTFPSSAVSISPAQWDALDPIIDGWKQVTLRFTTAPTMGAGVMPTWTWSAVGETSGNRWEVLGAVAAAVSGTPGNSFNLAFPQLSSATYGQPVSGAAIEMGWVPGYSPPVSGTTLDPSTDAALIVAQDMPTITGFTVTGATQQMTGIGLNCGLNPAFIPSALTYNQLTWGSVVTNTVRDTFTRTVSGGWGTSDSSVPWTIIDGPASGFSVAGGVGIHTHQVAAVNHTIGIPIGSPNQIGSIFFQMPSTPASGTNVAIVDLRARVVDITNAGILLRAAANSSTVSVTLGGDPDTITLPFVAGAWYGMKISAIGQQLQGKVWNATSDAEPTDYQLTALDSNWTTAGSLMSAFSFVNTGTSLPFTINFDNFSAYAFPVGFGGTELQRSDSLTDWQTIMLSRNGATTGFKDYEARIGLATSYRIRMLSTYDFAGPWSTVVTSTLTSPGVSGTSLDSTSHVLTFTTNSHQDGSSNLAYALGWEGEISEDFSFPESASQVLQPMYGRDYVTVFRPEERGGTNFTRTLLVQAAAISPPTLEDFTSLRNMAWADVPYICVRDEDGNRWFANVSVPSGAVRRDRRLYLAPITIIQVTDTPTQVNA